MPQCAKIPLNFNSSIWIKWKLRDNEGKYLTHSQHFKNYRKNKDRNRRKVRNTDRWKRNGIQTENGLQSAILWKQRSSTWKDISWSEITLHFTRMKFTSYLLNKSFEDHSTMVGHGTIRQTRSLEWLVITEKAFM